jgi:hypothetical protein
LVTSTTGFAAGAYTYYAVATDAAGVSSTAAAATLTVAAPTGHPIIGSFTVSAASVTAGATVTLAAGNVTDTGSTITSVSFYLANSSGGKTLLNGAVYRSGSTWSMNVSTTGAAAGTYTFYAIATDAQGISSAAASATLTVTLPAPHPAIAFFAVYPTSTGAAKSVTLVTSGVTDPGSTITGVSFYLGNSSGGETKLTGTVTHYQGLWYLTTSITGFAPGTYTFYAVATDTAGVSSSPVPAALKIVSGSTANQSGSNQIVDPTDPATWYTWTVESDGTIVLVVHNN